MLFGFFYTKTRSIKWIEIIDKVMLWSIVIFYWVLDIFQFENYIMNSLRTREIVASILFLLSTLALIHIEQLISYYVDKIIFNIWNKI